MFQDITTFYRIFKYVDYLGVIEIDLVRMPLLRFWSFSAKKLKSLAQSKNENPRSNPVYPPISANNDDLAYASWLALTWTDVGKYIVSFAVALILMGYIEGNPKRKSIVLHAGGQPLNDSPS